MKVLCVIPCLPSELKMEALRSVFSQTFPVSYVYLLTAKADSAQPLPAKISVVLNDGLKGINLEAFDYILHIDNDTVLPPDFIEKHVGLGDVVGGSGYAQLISTRFFRQTMGGKFNQHSDDTYTYFKAKASGCQTSDLQCAVRHREPGVRHGVFSYCFYTGKLDYMIGFDPVHVLSWLRFTKASLARCAGYFWALLFSHRERFEFARTEQNKYVKLLMGKFKL